MEAIIVATVAAIPATIASLAAWRNARAANHQTNGQLQEPLNRIEAKIDDLAEWQAQHVTRWHSN
jgi:hypothetical protein